LKKFTNRKSILSILLCLAILGALMVPAVPASAAPTTFITVVAGSSSYTVTTDDLATLTPVSISTAYTKDTYATLSGPVAAGQPVVGVKSVVGFKVTESVTINDGLNSETKTITAIDAGAKTFTMDSNLVNSYMEKSGGREIHGDDGKCYNTWNGYPLHSIMESKLDAGLTATSYNVLMTATDGYLSVVGPNASPSTTIAANNNLILASSNEGGALTTPTLASTSFTTGKYFASKLSQLELVYLISVASPTNGTIDPMSFIPALGSAMTGKIPVSLNGSQTFTFTGAAGYHVDTVTVDSVEQIVADSYTFDSVTSNHTLAATFSDSSVNVFIDPPTQNVRNGRDFTVDIAINTNTAIRGWQSNLSFDADKLILNSIAEGTFLSKYAAADNSSIMSLGSLVINNTLGTASLPAYAIMGGTGGPVGTGSLCTLNFTAKDDINDIAVITPEPVNIADINAEAITGVTATAGSVSIGTVPKLTLTAPSAKPISAYAATLNGRVSKLGPSESVDVWFEWGLTKDYGFSTEVQNTAVIGTFSAPLIDLTPATTYYFRFVAQGDYAGAPIVYGSPKSFKTTKVVAPGITASSATDKTKNSATLNGKLTKMGASDNVTLHFEYSTEATYDNSTTTESFVLGETGKFTAELIGLDPGTTYNFRIVYQGDYPAAPVLYTRSKTFKTSALSAPTVTTASATDKTATSATLNGRLSNLGTADSVEVYFEYWLKGDSDNTTSTDVNVMTAKDTFSVTIEGLTPGETYYFRAVGVGDKTKFASSRNFKTAAP
jgi:hypothetical protein